MKQNPRSQIERFFREGNLRALLKKSAEIHGHYCSFLALGVKATYLAFKHLGIVENPGMEEIMVMVDCNNCFTDGIQGVSGCTFGNNAMIYRDLGKTSATFWIRGRKEAIKITVKPYEQIKPGGDLGEELERLFNKAVRQRKKLTPEESLRMAELSQRMAFWILKRPEEEVLKIEQVKAPGIEYAPIFDSVICGKCGESVMESHSRLKQGKTLCLLCAGETYFQVIGRGIQPGR